MFTYPFAFYLPTDTNSTKLFEDNQQDLEMATEQLSEYLERDMDSQGDPKDLRRKVRATPLPSPIIISFKSAFPFRSRTRPATSSSAEPL